MKLTAIKRADIYLPSRLNRLISDGELFDSSCSPVARVYLVKDRCFIKKAAAGTLRREGDMYSYFHKKALAPEPIEYITDGEWDWLVTEIARGEDCTSRRYLDEPKRLCDTIAESLRMLHGLDYSDCPIADRNSEYFATAKKGYEGGIFSPDLFSGSFKIESADYAYKLLCEMKSEFRRDVLLHGDYCLPNVMLDDWRLSAFIDVGNGGVGDRHVDIFWGVWTLFFNLKSEKYTDRFLDAYGREAVRIDMLKAVAAAEVFA